MSGSFHPLRDPAQGHDQIFRSGDAFAHLRSRHLGGAGCMWSRDHGSPHGSSYAPGPRAHAVRSGRRAVERRHLATGLVYVTRVATDSIALVDLESHRVTASFRGGTVTEINTAADTVVRSFRPGGLPQDLVVGRGDSTLYLANEAGWVQVWNLKHWTRTDSIPVPAAFGLALTQDGEQLWVTETAVGGIAVVDGASRAVIETIPVLGSPRHLAMTPDGTTAVVANEAGVVQIIR